MEDAEYALCLTHDVDRPYKTYQSLYYAITERDPSHLRSLAPGANPYWQFETVMELEEELGVRSAFYFLNEKHLFREKSPTDWFRLENWKRYIGRYDIESPEMVDVIQTLDDGGWEIGLHGSYESYTDPERLKYEKEALEDVLGHSITGCRQHYLNLSIPETWRYHREIGFQYDASLGAKTEYGFKYGDDVKHPFDDEFAVFPLTIMEVGLPGVSTDIEGAWEECRRILDEAGERQAVVTILWHLRMFNEQEFPGYRRLYRRIVEYALEQGAWVGPPEELYEEIVQEGTTPNTLG
ncbi:MULTISPECIES: polysaccharide deacetylase family protein [Halostella]|uniref:polysaccharide deacetylase family protein n=1 Tax=Halostella TaxID=1843185 RepID=UPI001878491E|nr:MULTISPECIES: polysaccharide deacetylase family protein [Halostella]